MRTIDDKVGSLIQERAEQCAYEIAGPALAMGHPCEQDQLATRRGAKLGYHKGYLSALDELRKASSLVRMRELEQLILKLSVVLEAVGRAFCDQECGRAGHSLNCATLRATMKLVKEGK